MNSTRESLNHGINPTIEQKILYSIPLMHQTEYQIKLEAKKNMPRKPLSLFNQFQKDYTQFFMRAGVTTQEEIALIYQEAKSQYTPNVIQELEDLRKEEYNRNLWLWKMKYRDHCMEILHEETFRKEKKKRERELLMEYRRLMQDELQDEDN